MAFSRVIQKRILFNPCSDEKNSLTQYNTVELPNWQLSGNLETLSTTRLAIAIGWGIMGQ